MKTFLVKSLDSDITDEQLEYQGVQTTSFLSFRRAIEESLILNGRKNITEVQGYKIIDEGIIIVWK